MDALILGAIAYISYWTTKQSRETRIMMQKKNNYTTTIAPNLLDSFDPKYKEIVDKEVATRAKEGTELKVAQMSPADQLELKELQALNDNSKFVSLGDYNSRDLSDLLSRSKKETYVDIEKQMPVSMTQPKTNVSFIPSNRSHMEDFTMSAGAKKGVINENEITKDNSTLVDNKLIKMEDVDYRTLASHMVDNLINPIKGTYEVGVKHAVAVGSNTSQALQAALSKTELKFNPETSLTKLNYQLADVGTETSYLVSEMVKRATRQTSDIVQNMVGVVPTIKQGLDKVISGEASDSLRRTINKEIKRDQAAIPTVSIFDSHNNTTYLIKEDSNGQMNNRWNGSNTSKANANEMVIDREITSAKEKGIYRPIDEHMGFVVPHQGKKDSSSLTTTILRNVLRNHETSHMGQASKINMQETSDRDILATRIVNDLKGYKVPEINTGTYPTKSSHHTSSSNIARLPTKMIVETDNSSFKMTSAPNTVSNKTHTMVDSDNNNRSMQNTLPVYNGPTMSNYATAYSKDITYTKDLPGNFKLEQDGSRLLDVNGSSKRFQAERS